MNFHFINGKLIEDFKPFLRFEKGEAWGNTKIFTLPALKVQEFSLIKPERI